MRKVGKEVGQKPMTIESPIVLYKYKDVTGKGIEHVEGMLCNNRAWFSSPDEFNDPFDCRRPYDVRNTRVQVVLRETEFLARKGSSLSEALAQAERDIPVDPGELEEWQRQRIEAHSCRAANTGILCFTTVPDDQLMWAHYAKCHTGVCLMFRVRDEHEDSQLDFIAEAQPIEYADHCPVINYVLDDRFVLVQKAFLTKGTAFSYEVERRIVRYNDGPGLKPIPRGIIGGVILGLRMEPSNRERVIRACAAYDGDVNIIRAELEPATYGLRFGLECVV